MQMLLQIYLNDKLWNDDEWENILMHALNIYEKKKRSTKLNKPTDKETSNKITVDSESEEDYFDVSSDEEL